MEWWQILLVAHAITTWWWRGALVEEVKTLRVDMTEQLNALHKIRVDIWGSEKNTLPKS